MPKQIKEFQLDNTTGNVSVEYDDNSTNKFNAADMVTAQTDPVTGRVTFFNGAEIIPAPSPEVPKSRLIPKLHMQKFAAAANPIVCVIGDSTSFDSGSGSLCRSDLLYNQLTRRIRQDNPTKNIAFINRAIPGSTLNEFLTVSTHQSFVSTWYTNPSATWVSYVKNLGADTLLINWGVNDTYALRGDMIKAFLAEVATWTKVPDLVFITNKGAYAGAGAPYNAANYQAGYLGAASLIRSLAYSNANGFGVAGLPPIGLIDIGRYFQQAVNGIDPCEQYFVKNTTLSGSVALTSNYSFPVTDSGDFSVAVQFVNFGSSMNTARSVLKFTIGDQAGGSAANSSYVNVFPAADGTTTTTEVWISNNVQLLSVNAPNTWPSGTVKVTVTAKQEHLIVEINDKVVLDTLVCRPSVGFTPRVFVTNPPASFQMTFYQYVTGKFRQTDKLLSAEDTYGLITNDGVSGGNGINHDASQALNVVDLRVLEATDFAV